MANISFVSEVTNFYTNFSEQELRFQPWNDSSNESAMYTPSPSSSSISGTFHLSPTHSGEDHPTMNQPYLKIIEQPVSRFRFRYRSEMQGAHGSLLGRGETSKKRTYPTVQLVNYDGDAFVRCSLYTAEPPHIPHMHQLIGKENNKEVLDHEILVSERNGYIAEFKGLGIVHVSKKDFKKELLQKKEKMLLEIVRSDSSLRNFSNEEFKAILHSKMPQLEAEAENEARNMDPNKVKLRFEVFERGDNGQLIPVCENEVYSDTIQNMKSAETGELKICRMDRYAGSCYGGDEVFILVEKVCKKNIKIRFYELNGEGEEVWHDNGSFSDFDVHHQYAIVFRTPQYHDLGIENPVQVKVELVRPKDNATSEPLTFTYKPARGVNRKRRCLSDSSNSLESLRPSIVAAAVSSDQDPMVSGSETSSLNSLSFPSDMLRSAMSALGNGMDPDLSVFERFVYTEDFGNYTQSFNENEQQPGPEGNHIASSFATGVPSPNMSSPDSREIFGDVPLLHEMDAADWTLPNMDKDGLGMAGFEAEPIVTDGCAKKKPSERSRFAQMAHKSSPSHKVTRSKWQAQDSTPLQKEDTQDLAKNAYTKLHKLMKSRNPSRLQDMKSIIRAQDHEVGPLHAAVFNGQLKELSDLLSLIIKSSQWKLINTVNRRKETPLMLAVQVDSVDCVKLLCMAGANINLTDHKENTAVHIAAKKKHSKCLQALLSVQPVKETLKREINLNKKNDDGVGALHIAVQRKDIDCVKLLVDAGADINIKMGTSGQTPLHLAVEYDCIDIISYLLNNDNIKPEEVNFNNKTALDLVKPKRGDIISLFKKVLRQESDEGSDDDILHIDEKNVSDEEEEEEEEDEEEEDEDSVEITKTGSQKIEDSMENLTMTEGNKNAASGRHKTDTESYVEENLDNIKLMDKSTLDIVANNLDKSDKWKVLCEELGCKFLIRTFTRVASPTRYLIAYLQVETNVTLPEFRDALSKLNVPDAVKAIDKFLQT